MKTHVQKWGNSYAVRIPKPLAQETGLGPDSMVDLVLDNGNVVIRPVRPPRFTLRRLLAGITKENLHSETDWGRPMGKEIW
jgi:antitoxin MazE